MVRTRDYYVLKGQVLADNAIFPQPIPTKEPISWIRVDVSVTNGATSNTALRPEDAVGKIEIMDGSKIIFSMPGWLSKAMGWWHDGGDSDTFYDQGPSAVQRSSIMIPFGYFDGDPDHWLDPAKFANLQVRITAIMVISATVGWATGTFSIDVIAGVFTDTPNPSKGFLVGKDIYTYTPAAAGDVVVQMPIDWPYRMIVVRTFLTATDFDTLITHAKLTADGDLFVPYDLDIAAIRKNNVEWRGCFRQKAVGFGANTYAYKVPVGKLVHADCVPYTTLTFGGAASAVNDTVTITTVTVTVVPAIAAGAAMRFGSEYGGTAPYFSFALPFGNGDQDAQFFTPLNTYKDVRLKLTTGAAFGVTDVGLIQLAQPF